MNLEPLYSLIREFEGLRLTPYYCPAGVLTVGYGSTGEGVHEGISWTKEECEERMQRDIQKFVTGTIKLCPILALEENNNRLCAIADFAYNLGLGNLENSTLRKRVNAQDWGLAKSELLKWTKADGKILPGLIKRRISESRLLD